MPRCADVRFRTLGCYPLTGAVESTADTLPAIIQEMLLTRTSERQGRLIDHDAVRVDGEEEAGGVLLDGDVRRLRPASPPTSASTCAGTRRKSLLRFITCGSVDDGKSTLIGRLLYESKMLFDDQLAAIEADSRKWGTQGDEIDFALLVDGLAAEREQGITIDVAYRYFSTDRRKFIVADTPGHEQYTRNMVTGASTADAAVILVDARHGIATQTRRHSYLVSLIGIRHVVLAVNKMDLVGHSQKVFDAIVAEYSAFAAQLGIAEVTPIPVSALRGDNIVEPSDAHALVPRADADGVSGDRRARRDARPGAAAAPAGAVGESAGSRLPRLHGADRLRLGAHRTTASACCRPAARRPSPASSPTAAIGPTRWPASPSRSCSRARRTSRAAT